MIYFANFISFFVAYNVVKKNRWNINACHFIFINYLLLWPLFNAATTNDLE